MFRLLASLIISLIFFVHPINAYIDPIDETPPPTSSNEPDPITPSSYLDPYYQLLHTPDSSSYSSNPFYANYTPSDPSNPPPHPLRPFPFKDPVDIKNQEELGEDYLTPYCVTRPTAVKNGVDIRTPEAYVNDPLKLNFKNFYTPILSITNVNSPAFKVTTSDDKVHKYLADYLGGRAYYELFAEPDPDESLSQGFKDSLADFSLLTSDQLNIVQSAEKIHDIKDPQVASIVKNTFLPARAGVFRQLAPQSYQDELKIALIQRATGKFSLDENPYGFIPSSKNVKNYTVACWDGQKVVDFSSYPDCSSGVPIKLSAFTDNYLKPLPKDYPDQQQYADAVLDWSILDGGSLNPIDPTGKTILTYGKWYKLWPYVPMFSREDTIGYIDLLEEDNEYGNQTALPAQVQVTHPHLARTYELASAISSTLSPFKPDYDPNHQPDLVTPTWVTPAPWSEEAYWIDSGNTVPGDPGYNGPVCQPLSQVVTYTGDLAKDRTSTVIINQDLPPGLISPRESDARCGKEFACEVCVPRDDGTFYLNDANCFRQVRFSPVYLLSTTPFIDAISNALTSNDSEQAVFNFFRTHQEIKNDPTEDWPAIGYDYPNSALSYSFPIGQAESGNKLTPEPVPFLYKSLGWIHCEKHDLFNRLLPNDRQLPPLPECSQSTSGFTPPDLPPGVCNGEAFAKLGPPSETTQVARNVFESTILPNLTEEVVSAYAEAEKQTGVPCEVLAGIHFVEGGNNPNRSLVSGRYLGTPEPDAGGQIFNSLVETAIYAANHLKGKVGGSINNINTLITALSRYNGGGNSNCLQSYACSYASSATSVSCPVDACCDLACRETCASQNSKTIYDYVYSYPPPPFCPTSIEGFDDIYPVNWYDQDHQEMYLLFCLDRTMCTPQIYQRPGALTVAVEYYLSHSND